MLAPELPDPLIDLRQPREGLAMDGLRVGTQPRVIFLHGGRQVPPDPHPPGWAETGLETTSEAVALTRPVAALVQVAEADGNRTRQRRCAPLTGFEDRGGHQAPRRLRS
jgi:hypothetical protein